jgi:hypothetical protein
MAATSPDQSILLRIVDALQRAKLDFVLIGNAAAALQGAPVMTADIDFMVRDAPITERKLRVFAELSGMALTRPFEPTSMTVRAVSPEVTVDFVFALSNRRSFESLRSRAQVLELRGIRFRVADLGDIIESKQAAGRAKDLAVLPILRATWEVRKRMDANRPPNRRR